MSVLQDLKITRKALEHWTDNICWGKDGTLYISTQPQLTVCEPVFNKPMERQLKSLFHSKELDLPKPDNKFENSQFDENQLLLSQPEPVIERCIPSSHPGLIAAITKHGNVILYQGNNLVSQIDNPNAPLPTRAYHSLCWNEKSDLLFTGSETNSVEIFSVSVLAGSLVSASYKASIQLSTADAGNNQTWVTHMRYKDGLIVCANSNNEVYVVNLETESAKKIKNASRCAITDIQFVGNNILISSIGSLVSYNTKQNISSAEKFDICAEFFIIPLPDEESAILLSNKTGVKVQFKDSGFILSSDDIISPTLEKRFLKWNNTFNEYHKYETKLYIRGCTISPDGYTVAVLYDIEKVLLKYSIPSEQVFRLLILPLSNKWEVSDKASGLAWYQSYAIYNELPMNNACLSKSSEFDCSLSFPDYLSSILESKDLLTWRFNNLIEDVPSAKKIHEYIFMYVMKHLDEVENPLDKAYTIWLSQLLERKVDLELDPITFNGPFISEEFDFQKNANQDIITSELNHKWRRCSVTGFPLLSTFIRICPVSKTRVIDIEQDKLNEYGWLSTTVLKTFGNISIFTGTKMTNV
ncbi:transcription factor tau 60 kDa subunit [Kluyveromyces marxianus]|uniref:Transcription factor tau 60 kDa subunit n=2 Tax=Kluyveromyces marxianus TaxID=4911 RepID=W0T9Q6_KLUMD|nr:transcription factor tau 60 kDa subunit [Kluyveromyces marxianus DMKU3-1042]QGN16078.1 transcription factor tau 60 kDa subunit [Kluyveromyces marxianus]BAO40347.1 transcription factor tau 60 kDa subunit [Kluyveromyces marxianus DMKU3-1042]BAP71835.1 transcription factor tau 60 kDa subunit [Kluyveromyces marxianus]